MVTFYMKTLIFLNSIRFFPHIILFYFHKNKRIIQSDIRYWLTKMKRNYSQSIGLIFLLTFYPHFRNLFYNRIGTHYFLLNLICPPLSTLSIQTNNIGEGFYIENGYGTGISAVSIGKNCLIYQLVVIGFSRGGCPTILDNVTIRPGAVILGKITIGNNVVIGANATVFQDVHDNCTVYPPLSRIMQWNPQNVNMKSIEENPLES